MPKQNKKRGKRSERKRKLEGEEDGSPKRQKYEVDDESFAENADYIPLDGEERQRPNDIPFYGLLDSEESEYFRKAGEMMELNQFSGPEDRDDFVRSVYDQVQEKELKLAFAQTGSRTMERLIQLSSPAQLKTLFQAFTGNFLYLVQHRFASHCCETLFAKAAPLVSSEMSSSSKQKDETEPSMEELYLGVVSELEENLGFLLPNTFATHPIRILLLVLAGKPINVTGSKSGLHSRKKERVTVMGGDKNLDPALLTERTVPASFSKALESLIVRVSSGDDVTNNLQSLSINPICNPTLQLLLRLETTQYGKNQSLLLKALLPDDPLTAESSSASFITNSLFHPVGSRLLEVIIEVGPAKTFKAIYKHFFKDRLSTMAKNDVASYVFCTAVNRMGKDDLEQVISVLIPEIPMLVERNRLNVIRTLIERANSREIPTRDLEGAITEAYAASTVDPENPLATLDMIRMLHLSVSKAQETVADQKSANGPPNAQQHAQSHHAAALVSTILSYPTPLATAVINSLTVLQPQLMHSLSTSHSSASALIAALTSPAATPPLRRKLIARLYGQLGSSLALSPAGAAVLLDGVWPGTRGIAFVRERVAEELAENEGSIKASGCGRRVWKGWGMDAFRRRRGEWEKWSRGEGGSGGGFVGFPERGAKHNHENETSDEQTASKSPPEHVSKRQKHMTALERARQRHMSQRARREELEADKNTPQVVEAT